MCVCVCIVVCVCVVVWVVCVCVCCCVCACNRFSVCLPEFVWLFVVCVSVCGLSGVHVCRFMGMRCAHMSVVDCKQDVQTRKIEGITFCEAEQHDCHYAEKSACHGLHVLPLNFSFAATFS